MTGLPAVYSPLNLHNEQPSDLRVHKRFQGFEKISQAHMVFSYLPFSSPLRGQRFVGNGDVSWTSLLNPYRGACCVSPGLSPHPVSLVIFWKQVYTASVVLLNLSRKLYCNCKSLEGEGCCLFVFLRGLFLYAREVFIWTVERGEDADQRICPKPAASKFCNHKHGAVDGWWDVCSQQPISVHVWLWLCHFLGSFSPSKLIASSSAADPAGIWPLG